MLNMFKNVSCPFIPSTCPFIFCPSNAGCFVFSHSHIHSLQSLLPTSLHPLVLLPDLHYVPSKATGEFKWNLITPLENLEHLFSKFRAAYPRYKALKEHRSASLDLRREHRQDAVSPQETLPIGFLHLFLTEIKYSQD